MSDRDKELFDLITDILEVPHAYGSSGSNIAKQLEELSSMPDINAKTHDEIFKVFNTHSSKMRFLS